jgi:hypothetical protein
VATQPTGRGAEVRELAPTHCPNGHELKPPNVQAFHLPCSCAGPEGHRGWRCWTCQAVTYDPPHNPETPGTMGSQYDR